MGTSGTAARILNLCFSTEEKQQITIRSEVRWGSELVRMLRISLSQNKIDHRFLGRPACSLVLIHTELPRLHFEAMRAEEM
jgi:hypothetical protein